MGYDPHKRPSELGSRSPGSEEAKDQNYAGDRGADQGTRTRGVPKQPAQESGRRNANKEQLPEERKHFEAGHAPSEQGEGKPSPESLKARQNLRGIGTQSGSHHAHGERTEEIGETGGPDEGHTRHGRQHVPGRGKRPPND